MGHLIWQTQLPDPQAKNISFPNNKWLGGIIRQPIRRSHPNSIGVIGSLNLTNTATRSYEKIRTDPKRDNLASYRNANATKDLGALELNNILLIEKS